MKMQDILIVGGVGAAAFYFFGSSAATAAPAAPTDTQGNSSAAPQDYNTQTGQPAGNYGTGADYQSHNPWGMIPPRNPGAGQYDGSLISWLRRNYPTTYQHAAQYAQQYGNWPGITWLQQGNPRLAQQFLQSLRGGGNSGRSRGMNPYDMAQLIDGGGYQYSTG